MEDEGGDVDEGVIEFGVVIVELLPAELDVKGEVIDRVVVARRNKLVLRFELLKSLKKLFEDRQNLP